MSKEKEELCECEKPGALYSGVKGIICRWQDGVPMDIERCDQCKLFPNDDIAGTFMILWTQRKIMREALLRIQQMPYDLKPDRDNAWYRQARTKVNIATKALRLDKRIWRDADVSQPQGGSR